MSQTRIYRFISNNHASLCLWWKKNLRKHQKVSKYYEHDCRFPLSCLQGRHSQILAFHFLTFALKACKEVSDLQSCDKLSLKKGDLYDTISRPYLAVFFVHFYEREKREFKIGRAMLLIILYISVIRVGTFLWWMVHSLCLEIKSWKLFSWSSFIVFKALFFIELLDCLEENIMTKGK